MANVNESASASQEQAIYCRYCSLWNARQGADSSKGCAASDLIPPSGQWTVALTWQLLELVWAIKNS